MPSQGPQDSLQVQKQVSEKPKPHVQHQPKQEPMTMNISEDKFISNISSLLESTRNMKSQVDQNYLKYERRVKQAEEEIRNIEHKLMTLVQKPQDNEELTSDQQ